jgi:hypothetical protein
MIGPAGIVANRLAAGVRVAFEAVTRRTARWRVGLPTTTPGLECAGAAVAGLAITWMFLVAAWGVDEPFGDGHFAAQAAIGIAADNMWTNHTIFPMPHYLDTPVSNAHLYMHHPLGVFWVAALFVKVFGVNDWALRLPAIVISTLSPFFVYRLGRAIWGPVEGALSAVAFASLPITLGFASYHALEGPTILGLVVASWGYARFSQTGWQRYVVASLVGFVWAINYEWTAYVWGVLFAFWVFLRAFVLPPRLFGPVEPRSIGRYWALLVGLAITILVVQLACVVDTGKLDEVLGMYDARASGNSQPLAAVLKARHVWIEIMYTGLAIALGKLATPFVVGRFAWKRSDLELLPAFLLVTAVVHYVHFKQGADIHIFWSQYFAPYFALAVGVLAATVGDLVVAVARRWRPLTADLVARRRPAIVAVVVGLPVLLVLRDGASIIRLAHDSGARFVSPSIKSDIDRIEALQWWIQRLGPKERLAFHPSIQPVHWAIGWGVRRHQMLGDQPLGAHGATPHAYTLDSAYAPSADVRQAAKEFHVDAVGRFWMMDRSRPATPLDGYSFEEHDPTGLAWYIHGGTEPLRIVRPDPWVTWQWRSLLGQPLPTLPSTPTTSEQLGIAHNAALDAGDGAAAARWRAALEARLNIKKMTKYDDGTVLLGAIHHRGAEHALSLYFLVGPRGLQGACGFEVYAKVEKRAFLSTLPLDPTVITLALSPEVPMDMWRPGNIYSERFTYRKRPGTERFYGGFGSRTASKIPTVVGAGRFVDLLTL